MKRFVTWMNHVPPLWWARFVLVMGLVALGCIALAWRAMDQAAQMEGEFRAHNEQALAIRDSALIVFDSLRATQCIPQHPGDRVVIYRAPRGGWQ